MKFFVKASLICLYTCSLVSMLGTNIVKKYKISGIILWTDTFLKKIYQIVMVILICFLFTKYDFNFNENASHFNFNVSCEGIKHIVIHVIWKNFNQNSNIPMWMRLKQVVKIFNERKEKPKIKKPKQLSCLPRAQ